MMPQARSSCKRGTSTVFNLPRRKGIRSPGTLHASLTSKSQHLAWPWERGSMEKRKCSIFSTCTRRVEAEGGAREDPESPPGAAAPLLPRRLGCAPVLRLGMTRDVAEQATWMHLYVGVLSLLLAGRGPGPPLLMHPRFRTHELTPAGPTLCSYTRGGPRCSLGAFPTAPP